MSRYDARVRKLEELQGAGDGTPCAVVRYTPSEPTGWWPLVEASLGFPSGRVALVIVDARDDAALLPEVVVPPVSEDRLTALQAAALASAGQDAGRWWIAIAGWGWTDAMPMHEGETALLSETALFTDTTMTSDNRTPAEKTGDGRFKPGNPGKPKGARHRVTRAIETLLEGQA